MKLLFVICSLAVVVSAKKSGSKYSKEANTVKSTSTTVSPTTRDEDYRPPKNFATTTERLFQMQKIQNIWLKGQTTLNAAKLKALFHDLKAQDKQEITFKKIKAQGKDTDGLQEAALRTQLSGIIERYGLQSSFPEHEKNVNDEEKFERMFKSKKLNKLWNKIEAASLDEKEMKILKEELSHHQAKLDQYYSFVDNLDESRDKTRETENSLGHFLDDEVEDHKKGSAKKASGKAAKQVKNDKVKDPFRQEESDLDKQFDELAMKVRVKLNDRQFTDERAIKLWKLAQAADFDDTELQSLREELHHFEHRLKKLGHLSHEMEMKENPESVKHMKSKLDDYEKKVTKIQDELRGRIARRTEL